MGRNSAFRNPETFAYRNLIRSGLVYERLKDVSPQVFYSGSVELLPGGRMTDVFGVLLAALLLVQVWSYYDFSAYFSTDERYYRQYSAILEGTPGGDKDQFLEEEVARFAAISEKETRCYDMVIRGEISESACQALAAGLEQSRIAEEPFMEAKAQCDWAKESGLDYVCLSGYQRLLGETGQRDWLIQTLKLFATLILGCMPWERQPFPICPRCWPSLGSMG